MKRAIPAIFLSAFVLLSFALPIAPAAASGVPQAVLDMRGSVVRVVCQSIDGTGSGSGFAIGRESPVQYIVTNYHVVEANPGGVSILHGDNQQIPAKVYLQLPDRDLCVLLLNDPLDVPPAALCDETPAQVGQAVYTLGFPAASDALAGKATGNPEDITVTGGIVSALKAWTIREINTPVSMVQIDASISPGNSGGPLVNEHGQVLGVNTLTMLLDTQNMNGAVSILELTGELRSRGIPYKSAPAPQPVGYVWYVIAGAAVLLAAAAVIVFIVLRGKKTGKKAKSIGLADYLRQWGGRLPYDDAIQVLGSALRELAALHAQGRSHGDVCPETIHIADNKALLLPPADTGGKLLLRPGFSAPEQFRADGRVGPWSDVYSVCAVLFHMVTGANPPGAMERQAAGGEGGFGFGSANIAETQAAMVYAGLMLDAAKRPQNCVELLGALGMPTAAAPAPLAGAVSAGAVPAGADAPVASITARPARARKRMGKGKRAVVIAASAFLFLCAGAAGLYIYNEVNYSGAVACISRQDYTGGIERLERVFIIFKSRTQWMGFACAGRDMQNRIFDAAREGFRALGDFNEAGSMLREVDYREALYVLSQGEFDRAKAMFAALGDYKDSAQMVFEADYQRAMSQLQNKEFDEAIKGFAHLARDNYKNSAQMALGAQYQLALRQLQDKTFNAAIASFQQLSKGNYKDSGLWEQEAIYQYAIYLYTMNDYTAAYANYKKVVEYKDSIEYFAVLTEKLYNDGIYFYRQSNYQKARSYFTLIAPYKRSNDYITLMDAYDVISNSDSGFSKMLSSLFAVRALGNFENANELSGKLRKLLKF